MGTERINAPTTATLLTLFTDGELHRFRRAWQRRVAQ